MEPEHIDLTGIVPENGLLDERSYDKTYLRDMIKHLEDIRKNSVDIVVKGDKINAQPGWALSVDAPQMGIKIYEPTDWAKGQTLRKLHIPKIYADYLQEVGREDLMINDINELMHMQDGVMVRTVGSNCRAILSPGYLPVDNSKIFQQVANATREVNMLRPTTQKPVQFWKANINDHQLYLHMIDEGREFDIGKSAKYSPMIVIKNSEVGSGSVTIEPGFMNWKCQNRHIMDALYRRAHRGVKLEEGWYEEDTRKTADELLQKQVRDWMHKTIGSDEVFEREAVALRESIEVKLDDIQEAVHRVADATNLTEAEETDIINAMLGDTTLEPEEKGSLYALIQGMTQAEKNMKTDRGYEISKIASNVPLLIKAIT